MDTFKVIGYNLDGNSLPVIIQQGDKKLLVKLRAGLSGEYSLLCEWLGNKIGSVLGLNTQQPQWIFLTEELEYDHTYVEVRDLIDKSLGLNIGFDYLNNVKAFDAGKISEIDNNLQIDIYLLDLLMFNIDRTIHNLNLLMNDTKLIITDFESGLIFKGLIHNVDLVNNRQVLQCFKANPFYQKIDSRQLNTFLNRINSIGFEEIIFGIPDELVSSQIKGEICKKIESKKSHRWNLDEILAHLENIELETELERNNRIKRNREKLEKSVRSVYGNAEMADIPRKK